MTPTRKFALPAVLAKPATLATLAALTTMAALAVAPASHAADAAAPAAQDATASLKASFADKGIAKLDRLNQSEAQRLCTEDARRPLAPAVREKLEREAQASVKPPSDGKYLGDWKEGEKIAQNGRGLQSSDDAKTANGGNCYACHQITKQEIAFGNIGPSLAQFGKLRGGVAEPLLKYTWSKIYNSHASNACSTMPRYGTAGILSEKQMQDLMALLLDPKSPVNE